MNGINAGILTIGDELLIGQTIDTNSAFIAQELNRIGIWVKKRVAVGDLREEILYGLEALERDCSVVIITGGLGPTADDITKPTLCEYFNTELVTNEAAVANVREIFAKIGRPLTERNLKQGEVPASCTVLPNGRGTAPGMWFEKDGVVYISLPGVPHEMKGLVQQSVIPKLEERFTLPVVLHRTLVTAGVGESTLADTLTDFEHALPPNLKLAYLPAYGVVRLRLTARGSSAAETGAEIERRFSQLQEAVAEWTVATEDVPLQEALIGLLKQKDKTMATAESCTGGYIAHLLTAIAGSSAVFNGSVVAYSNAMKQSVLGVPAILLERHGAVSEPVVRAMLQGVLETTGADCALATSGIMGPGGGSEEKPVGTVWIAVGDRETVLAKRLHFRFDRGRNIEMTAQTALTFLFRFLRDGKE